MFELREKRPLPRYVAMYNMGRLVQMELALCKGSVF